MVAWICGCETLGYGRPTVVPGREEAFSKCGLLLLDMESEGWVWADGVTPMDVELENSGRVYFG